jgi:hypothetical protein
VDEYRLGANPEPPGDAEEVSRSGAKVKDLP